MLGFGKTQKHHAKTFCLHFEVHMLTQKTFPENLLLPNSVLGTRGMMLNETPTGEEAALISAPAVPLSPRLHGKLHVSVSSHEVSIYIK